MRLATQKATTPATEMNCSLRTEETFSAIRVVVEAPHLEALKRIENDRKWSKMVENDREPRPQVHFSASGVIGPVLEDRGVDGLFPQHAGEPLARRRPVEVRQRGQA